MSDGTSAAGVTILVCGGRDYADRDCVYRTLDAVRADCKLSRIITGGAPGADTLAMQWAAERGVEASARPAKWSQYGRKAGPIRNQELLDLETPDVVIAFIGGPGTRDMMRRAAAAGVPVRWVVS